MESRPVPSRVVDYLFLAPAGTLVPTSGVRGEPIG
jgi:hypothetical protein